MNSNEIRKSFLDFFDSKKHLIVSSAPMVVKNDPTLMFTNAGMNQFKDIFLGNTPAKQRRIANTQKCLRVSGKHNDLEEVGHDTYHHTMFEMLGNWSFGDYFKKEAIDWGWEYLTQILELPKDRLYATYFEGSKEEGLEADSEALGLWKSHLAERQIIPGSRKDNFWEMGETGPCGPCSEIHIDLRSVEEREKVDGRELVNTGNPLVIEIWNLVFMQFNRKASGELEPLPEKHVDTGMGFERLCMAMQGKTSNYDTDLFQPMIAYISTASGKIYGQDVKADIAMRVISDHIRAIAFAITDGQTPSNNGAGYVIRRILRRAVRYGYTFLGFKEPFLYQLVDILATQFGEIFPEIVIEKKMVAKIIREEESSFLRTLSTGISRFEKYASEHPAIEGQFAFELYDTYGFPIDLTRLLAQEIGKEVDMEGFNFCLDEQKNRSRAATKMDTGDWVELDSSDKSVYVGYDRVECLTRVIKYRKVSSKGEEWHQIVLSETPFYAESGGQVGDTGFLEKEGNRIEILDTKKENNLIIHFAKEIPEDLSGTYLARIKGARRDAIASNHSATHLMHAALRSVLGSHVAQKGSLVNDEHLRFDFTHYAKMTDEEIKAVENIVNTKIAQAISLEERREVPMEQAQKEGAVALFGEKYGDTVRIISFDREYSTELCGGIHVENTSRIRLFKIISEGAIANGIRRITAVTGVGALHFLEESHARLQEVKELLNNPNDVVKYVQELDEENKALKKEVEQLS
jgi:alanyl-tRNA synthetase